MTRLLRDAARWSRPLAPAAGLLLALVLAFAVFESTRPRPVRRSALNLLVITLDTTRADRVGAYGNQRVATPNLDWLAATGTAFEQATAAAPLTLPSHCSLFTGHFPPGHGVRENAGFVLGDRPPTLAELLRDGGYHTAAFVASYIVRRETGLARGFGVYVGTSGVTAGRGSPALRLSADVVTNEALAWLERSPSPFFAWIHFYDAHSPCDPPRSYRARYPGQPYDATIAFMDSQVGRLVGSLRRRGLLERTVIVVIADHGESLGEHGEFTHALRLYEGVLHVPFIVRAPLPGASGRRVHAVVRGVDLMPTALSLLGVQPPPDIDGVSLAPLMLGKPVSRGLEAYAETLYPLLRRGMPAGYALRSGPLKLIEQGEARLFDVGQDPGETHDLARERPDLAAELQVRLERLKRGMEMAGTTPGREERARLAALGYVTR